ncbi:MAG: formylmethanofuran dehydrogenase subunit B [Sulfurifustaceae bacterium]
MTEARPPQRHVNVTCPFCGLGCDDLEINVDASGVRVEANGCPISNPAFARSERDAGRPAIAGRPAPLSDAIARAAAILQRAKAPLIGGLGTDVGGMRAALALAERLGATLDHANGAALQRNTKVLQDSGGITTTLSEVRNRADVLLFLGGDVSARFPRFYERLIERREPLFAQTPRVPDMVFLGGTAPSQPPADARALVMSCPPESLGEVINVLRALLRGRTLDAPSVAGIAVETLRDVATRLKTAHYSVIVWAAAQLDFPHADLTIAAAAALIKQLNRKTRCAGLPLGGRDGDLTANQVATWQTGYPLPVSFARGFPDYDPHRYAGSRVLGHGAADALLWISAFDDAPEPPATGVPTVVLARAGATLERAPDVYIPVATPGVDHAGDIFRCDGVVALPLRALRSTELPSVAQTLRAIAQQLGAALPC